ncbi:MAG: hypothetical protein M3350_11115 [Actinomycetota bacterium]|nr:hypothetical protein [Actinomycetota bacterium]MDQ3721310.1 hypothetical protein [Actinomycetota bacterium]
MTKRIGRPSPALVISLVALFVAFGGTSYAALRVGSKQIVNNSVRGKDIRNGTIAARDVKRNGLGGRSVKESSLGKVNSAGRADTAGRADSAGSASSATTARSATSATTAGTATTAKLATGLAANTVGSGQLQSGSVRASDLGTIDTHQSTPKPIAPGKVEIVTVACDPDERLISGGGLWTDLAGDPDVQMVRSARVGGGSWAVGVRNNTNVARNFIAEAYCMDP